MTISLPSRPVKIKYALGEFIIWEWSPNLTILEPTGSIIETLKIPDAKILKSYLNNDTNGILARRVDLNPPRTGIVVENGLIFYTQPCIDHFFIEINSSFDEYISKFSSKSRQNIIRSVRKIESSNRPHETFFQYTSPNEIDKFLDIARNISRQTYQTQLLKSGLPETEAFRNSALEKASRSEAYGYILNVDNKPVAFAWCRKENNRLIYDIIGYLPEYSKQSPGTALLYLILKSIYAERIFSIFDFGPGCANYKEMFSNLHVQYNETYIFTDTVKFRITIYLHSIIDKISIATGKLLYKFGFKTVIKKLLRKLIKTK